jgi:hypothetical protein
VQFSSQSECSDEITHAANRLTRLTAQRSLDLKADGQIILPEVLSQVYLGSPRKRFLEELQVLAKLNDRSSPKVVDSEVSIVTIHSSRPEPADNT